MRHLLLSAFLVLLCPVPLPAQNRADDEYTRYELLSPESSSFKIVYDVTAVTPGARFYFNPIRRGSVASDESVIDLASGQPLKFEQITGAAAREAGLSTADLDGEYIKVTLARPVPAGGEARIRIIKTYKDPKSYFREGDTIVFDRSLGIRRNAVVLPPNYELIACNIPSQILEEPDGRVGISFMNTYPVAAPLVLRARPLRRGTAQSPSPAGSAVGPRPAEGPVPPEPQAPAPREVPMDWVRVSERAVENREIVYFLNDPATHSFSLYHDYTETREGVDTYLNVVRRGSTVSGPAAKNLDTGDVLRVETLKGEAIRKAAIDIGEPIARDSEVVVIRFPAVTKGKSIRLRIEETYTDPARYALIDGQLTWRRSFGRPRNDIVLPAGWRVTTSSIPATVSLTPDRRVRLAYVNPRPDSIEVFLRARRQAS
ncbi:MAG TPA: hypothetical protein VFV54_00355 [Thermoanaerobaculia bacterium]|nr:hypothetical protein [Thermoanaerobaculia bacterium]